MKKIEPDYSFVRDGHTLEEWLWKLLDESESIRAAAGDALKAMEWGLPSAHTDLADITGELDIQNQTVRFAAAIKDIMADAKFDTRGFIEKLSAFRLVLATDWKKRGAESSKRDEKYDRLADDLIETINTTDSKEKKEEASERFAKLSAIYICGGCAGDIDPMMGGEVLASSGMAASRVYQLLDEELLVAPEIIESFLSDSKLRHDALSAIERIGAAASEFAPHLIQDLDGMPEKDKQSPYSVHFDAEKPLGIVARDNACTVDELVARLSHDEKIIRVWAASTFEHVGISCCHRENEICELLLPMLEREDEWVGAIHALASVGRDLPHIRSKVLAIAGSREKKLEKHPDFEDEVYDQMVFKRGNAIYMMKYFTDYPDECMPILIEAMQSFEEYDPDECYSGPLGRIAGVIEKFGASASAAAIPLAAHLNDDPDDIPTAILNALASMGPGAMPAIPNIIEMRNNCEYDMDGDIDNDVIDVYEDIFGWAIQQIRGIPKS